MGLGPVLEFWRSRPERPAPVVRDWSQQELAQFYRVEWALGQAGISVETDRGLSDEGDPWFAFCRASDGEVVIHIAREGDIYLLAGFLSDRIQRGRDFAQLVERLLAEHPAKAIDKRDEGNVVMHPATLLALLVSIAFLHSNEGKAAAVDPAEDAGLSRVAVALKPPTANIGMRSPVATLAGTAVTLAATFELAQAMTILRVANLLNQVPEAHSTAPVPEKSSVGLGDGGIKLQSKAALSPEQVVAVQTHANEVHSSSALDMSSLTVPAAQPSIEHLLEVVAKLWTLPDLGGVPAVDVGISAARAFFGAMNEEAGDPAAALLVNQAGRSFEGNASSGVVQNAVATSSAPSGLSLTIVHTSASTDSMAQTVLKLSFADHGEVSIRAASVVDTAALVSIVGELVAHAKEGKLGPVPDMLRAATDALTLLPEVGDAEQTAVDPAPEGDGEAVLTVDEDAVATSPKVDDKPAAPLPDVKVEAPAPVVDAKIDVPKPADKGAITESYTTVYSDRLVKHEVLNSYGTETVKRAIAAFKEDVANFAISVSGDDVIFFSPDAVAHHGSEVVVELWQFKDGSSVALVGLSVDGFLPYSL